MARVVLTVGQHPEEPETLVMAVTKLNVTRKPKALTFEINSLPDELKRQDRSQLVFGDFIDLTSDEIMVVAPAKKDVKDMTKEFLEEFLTDGPKTKGAVERAAKARGLTLKAVYKRAAEMGIIRERSGFAQTRTSTWALPGATEVIDDANDDKGEN